MQLLGLRCKVSFRASGVGGVGWLGMIDRDVYVHNDVDIYIYVYVLIRLLKGVMGWLRV